MVQFQLSAYKKQIKCKNKPKKLEFYLLKLIVIIIRMTFLKKLREYLSNFFKKLILKQTSKEQKNEVLERFNISSVETLAKLMVIYSRN